MTPKEYVDEIVAGIKDLWKLMNISNDDFIRTTDERHEKAVQKIFKQLYDQGDIYKSEYEGWYCTPCESFWLERQLVDGKCPDCGRPVQRTKEEMLLLPPLQICGQADSIYRRAPGFHPAREPEKRDAAKLPAARPGGSVPSAGRRFKWGIPVTFDDKHVIYVWIDALSNYITALGYLSG